MPLNDRESPEIREEIKLVSNEDVKAVLKIKHNNLNGNFLLKKKNFPLCFVFLCVFLMCVNELKQDMNNEQELLLRVIMIMKFRYSHCKFPSAHLGHHFHLC